MTFKTIMQVSKLTIFFVGSILLVSLLVSAFYFSDTLHLSPKDAEKSDTILSDSSSRSNEPFPYQYIVELEAEPLALHTHEKDYYDTLRADADSFIKRCEESLGTSFVRADQQPELLYSTTLPALENVWRMNIPRFNSFNAKEVTAVDYSSLAPQHPIVVMQFTHATNGFMITLNDEDLKNLRNCKGIRSITPNYPVYADLQYAVPTVRAPETWRLNATNLKRSAACPSNGQGSHGCLTGKGVKVAVLDTGVDYTHPAFGGTGVNPDLAELLLPTSDPIRSGDLHFFPGDPIRSGDLLAYYTCTTCQGDGEIHLYNITSGVDRVIMSDFLTGAPYRYIRSFSLSGTNLVYGFAGQETIQPPSQFHLRLLDLSTNEDRELLPPWDMGSGFLPSVLLLHDTLLVHVNFAIDFQEETLISKVYAYDLETGEDTLISEANESPVLSNEPISSQFFFDGHTLAYKSDFIAEGSNMRYQHLRAYEHTPNNTWSEYTLPFTENDYLTLFGVRDRSLYLFGQRFREDCYIQRYDLDTGRMHRITPCAASGSYPNNMRFYPSDARLGPNGTIAIATHARNLYVYDENRYKAISRGVYMIYSFDDNALLFGKGNSIYTHSYNSSYEYLKGFTFTPLPNKIPFGYNFILPVNPKDPFDGHGHGTHVTSTLAGLGAHPGVAPGALIYSYKVLDDFGSGFYAAILAAYDRALDPNMDGNLSDRVDIVSMSLGGGCPPRYTYNCGPDDVESRGVDHLSYAGITVVAAAGNGGELGAGSVISPGTARTAITVGASCRDAQLGDLYCSGYKASFSSLGPVTNVSGSVIAKPDILAPGVALCAARSSYTISLLMDEFICENGNLEMSGTSMSTPIVSGGVALMKQADPTLTPLRIKQILVRTTRDLGLPRNEQGAGQLDVYSSVRRIR